jgi:hypothetical protein
MLKSAVARAAFTAAIGGFALLFVVAGCESAQEKADRLAEAKMQDVERQQEAAADASQLDSIQSQYDQLANDSSSLSPRMQILLRGHQAQVRFERANLMLAQLRSKELEITRTISDLEKMAVQITGTQASVTALEAYDPTTQIQAIHAKQAAMQGSPGDTDPALITLSGLQSTIDNLNASVAKNGQDAVTLKQTRDDSLAKADALTRQSEGEQGDQQLADTTQASQLRNAAGIADAQLDTLASQFTQLQADLDSARAKQTAMQSASATLDLQIQAIQSGWASIQEQIDAQRKLEQQIIGGDSSDADAITINQLATQLNTLLSDASTLRDSVSSELDQAVTQFGVGASEAETLRSTLMRETNGPAATADAPILRETMDTLHPLFFNQQMAAAMETRAGVSAAKAEIDLMMSQLLDGFVINAPQTQPTDPVVAPVKIPGLLAVLSKDQTGVDVPQSVATLPKTDADALKQLKDDVDSKFQEAVDAYNKRYGADDQATAQQHNAISYSGLELTNVQWAHYASLMGDEDAARQHLADAATAQGQIPAGMLDVNSETIAAPQSSPGSDNSNSNGQQTTPSTPSNTNSSGNSLPPPD